MGRFASRFQDLPAQPVAQGAPQEAADRVNCMVVSQIYCGNANSNQTRKENITQLSLVLQSHKNPDQSAGNVGRGEGGASHPGFRLNGAIEP